MTFPYSRYALRSIKWKYVCHHAVELAFPGGNFAWELFLSPVTVPWLFVLVAFQQYNLGLLIEKLRDAIALLEKSTKAL